MVFKSKDSNKIYLLFGNDEATAPDYDISAYIEEIEKINQENTTLLDIAEKMTEEKEQKKALDLRWLLNISVIGVSALLILLIIRKKSVL